MPLKLPRRPGDIVVLPTIHPAGDHGPSDGARRRATRERERELVRGADRKGAEAHVKNLSNCFGARV